MSTNKTLEEILSEIPEESRPQVIEKIKQAVEADKSTTMSKAHEAYVENLKQRQQSGHKHDEAGLGGKQL